MAALVLADSMVPGWIVLPLAGATMLFIALHVLAVQISPMDMLRKRLRISNGLIMMLVTAMLAYALGVADIVGNPRGEPAKARAFVLIWMAIVGLLGIVVAIAVADALGTAREALRQRRQMRHEMRERLAENVPAGRGAVRRG